MWFFDRRTSPAREAASTLEFSIRPTGTARAPLGAVAVDGGVDFAVFSEHATSIAVCLFDDDARETHQLVLPERQGSVWQGHVPGLKPGARYGLRADGPNAPDQGHRFNRSKLLIDPYARELTGGVVPAAALLGSNDRDSASLVPKAIIQNPADAFDWGEDRRPKRSYADTVIYEAHVKGLTALQSQIPEDIRGTYDALAHPVMLDHYARLGITAIELLPIQGFINDAFLLKRGLTNYWGYNTLTFFAPEQRYAAHIGPGETAKAMKRAVRALHAANIEVLLDVVYNHTAEGGHAGPHLSFRGLDNASYYRLEADNPAHYVNDTGCGNTVNAAHPMVLRMILDSLRYWVEDFHIDGFRFDLAPVLGREDAGYDRDSSFLRALMQDPLLSTVKLIAEPWDIGPGGYQLGGFPAGFAEWNDRFRDDARRFWRHDKSIAPSFAGRLTGSADVFDHSGRKPWASVNFVTAHDGFTLADTTAFEKKHNQANRERNRDGHNGNHSSNLGVEGATDDAGILARRAQRQRNLIATVLVSQGTPMLLAGDEFGNSQGGNNNAYCQDNNISWLDWADADDVMFDFTGKVIALRQAYPMLRQSEFLHGDRVAKHGPRDIEWLGFHNVGLDWERPGFDRFAVVLRQAAPITSNANRRPTSCATVVIAFNAGDTPGELALPHAGAGGTWSIILDTANPATAPAPVKTPDLQKIAAESLTVFADQPHEARR